MSAEDMAIPALNLKFAEDPERRASLLDQLRDSLFNVGFLYITNHGVPEETISDLSSRAPELFSLSDLDKSKLSKINSPHFLGYSGLAEETTQGKRDLREQFDFATELPVIYLEDNSDQYSGRDFSRPYWRLRGPNQWPNEDDLPGFKRALLK
jgi:isopenicillin N synthase-like dioxygenase